MARPPAAAAEEVTLYRRKDASETKWCRGFVVAGPPAAAAEEVEAAAAAAVEAEAAADAADAAEVEAEAAAAAEVAAAAAAAVAVAAQKGPNFIVSLLRQVWWQHGAPESAECLTVCAKEDPDFAECDIVDLAECAKGDLDFAECDKGDLAVYAKEDLDFAVLMGDLYTKRVLWTGTRLFAGA